MALVYHRQSRTLTSEQYEITDGGRRVGYLDLHFGQSDVTGTLVLESERSDEDLTRLIEDIDEDLVLPTDMPRDREDFLLRIFVGREVGLFSDDLVRGDALADDGIDGNGAFSEE